MMLKLFMGIVLFGLVACHGGVEKSEVLEIARSPHGIEVMFQILPGTNQIYGELLEVRDNGFLIEVGIPHELVFVPLDVIVKAAFSQSPQTSFLENPKNRGKQKLQGALKKLPRSSDKRQKLLSGLRPLSRFPQGLSPALTAKLQTELGINTIKTLTVDN